MAAGNESQFSQLSTFVKDGTKQKVKQQLDELLNICPSYVKMIEFI